MSFFEYREYRQQYCRGCHANKPMDGASRCERHLFKSQKDRSDEYSRRLRNFLGQCMQYFVTAASAASFQRHPTPLHYTVSGDALFASCTLALPSVCTHDLVRLCQSTVVSTFLVVFCTRLLPALYAVLRHVIRFITSESTLASWLAMPSEPRLSRSSWRLSTTKQAPAIARGFGRPQLCENFGRWSQHCIKSSSAESYSVRTPLRLCRASRRIRSCPYRHPNRAWSTEQ